MDLEGTRHSRCGLDEQQQTCREKLLAESSQSRPGNLEKGISDSGSVDIIPGRFIITLDGKALGSAVAPRTNAPDTMTMTMNKIGIANSDSDVRIFRNAIYGFAANLSADQLAQLKDNPSVKAIEPDKRISLEMDSDWGEPSYEPRRKIPTGVARVEGDLSKTARTPEGVNVDIAVIDSGINEKHPDLNVYRSASFLQGDPSKGHIGHDACGHGTHVAGIIAARGKGITGVAPGARLWAVQVLDRYATGSISDIVAGIDYVAKNAAEIDVANMSLGGKYSSPAIDAAISNAVDAGVAFVVAAGNKGEDAANFTPANNGKVLTVSAVSDTDGKGGGKGGASDDVFWNYSNFGKNVKIAAPGVDIESTWKSYGDRNDTYWTYSGTSMAAPHVAGGAGLLKAAHPDMKPLEVYKTLIDAGKKQSDPDYGFTGDKDKFAEPILNVKDF